MHFENIVMFADIGGQYEIFDIFKTKKTTDSKRQTLYETSEATAQSNNVSSIYSKVIFLNAYKNSPILSDRDYYRYIFTECGIDCPSRFHKNLIKCGYLVSDDNKNYHLSESGKQFIEDNKECCLVHKYKNKWDISWQEYLKAKKNIPFKSNFFDVMWSVFIQRQRTKHNVDMSTYRHMYELLNVEKRYSEAIEMLLKYYYLCFNNGMNYGIYLDYKKGNYQDLLNEGLMTKKDILPFEFHLSKYDINALNKLSSYLNDELINKIYSQFNYYPLKICSEKDFRKYINQIVSNEFGFEKTYKELNTKWNKLLKKL